jgi:MscS family membrane protein
MLSNILSLLLLGQTVPEGDASPVEPAGNATAPGAAPADAPQATVDITTQVIKHLEDTVSRTTMTGWILLFLGILGGLIAGKIAQKWLQHLGDGLAARGWVARGSLFQYASGPLNLALFTAGLAFGMTNVAMNSDVAAFVGKAIALFYVIALAWFLYNLVAIVEIGIRKITDDDTIVQLIRKALRIFLATIFGLFVAQNFFGADITAWLAGLGLAGLAVSLAAQGPIKNLFGSVTVVLDRPFGLGDRIKYGDAIGIVETMGFRSTKLRTMEGHLVTIPNSKLIEDVVENITARPYIRRQMSVTITYDTPPEKVELAVKIIRDLLSEPFMADTFNVTDFPPRVFFNQFNADSLNITVNYWYQLNVEGRDWWTFHAQSEEFNLRLLRAFNQHGIDFAFPTQTLHLAGDPDRQLAIRLLAENGHSLLPDGERVPAN